MLNHLQRVQVYGKMRMAAQCTEITVYVHASSSNYHRLEFFENYRSKVLTAESMEEVEESRVDREGGADRRAHA